MKMLQSVWRNRYESLKEYKMEGYEGCLLAIFCDLLENLKKFIHKVHHIIYLGVFVFANKSYYEIPGEVAKEINDMFK